MAKYKKEHGTSRVGDFLRSLNLKETLPNILNAGFDIVSGDFRGALNNFISTNTELTPEQREHALKLLEFDIVEQQEITKRWEADAHSDSWLSKNIRPMVLGYLIFCTSILIVADSSNNSFEVKEHWVTLLTSLLITTVGGYFALREYGKFASKKYK